MTRLNQDGELLFGNLTEDGDLVLGNLTENGDIIFGQSSGTIALNGTDNASISETLNLKVTKTLTSSDQASFTDSLNLSASRSFKSTDSVTTSETAILKNSVYLSSSDNVTSNETANLNNPKNLTATDGITTTNSASLTITSQSGFSASDSIAANDSGSLNATKLIVASDNAKASDNVNFKLSKPLKANDSETINETKPSLNKFIALTVSDSVNVMDTVKTSSNVLLAASDNVSINEAFSYAIKRGLQGRDTVILTDSSNLKTNYQLSIVDRLTVIETPPNIVDLNKLIVRTINLQGSRRFHNYLQGSRQLHILLKGGADVTVENQNFDFYANTVNIIDIPNITDDNGTLDLTSCSSIWFIAQNGNMQIYKDLTNGITAVNATTLSIKLSANDSINFQGAFKFEIHCIDSQQNPSILTTGILIIKPSLVKK